MKYLLIGEWGRSRRQITVLLVGAHQSLQHKRRTLLERNADIRIVGEASNGTTAIELAQALRPAVIVIELGLSGIDGITTAAMLRQVIPQCAILVISPEKDGPIHMRVRAAGVYALVRDADESVLLYSLIRQAAYSMTRSAREPVAEERLMFALMRLLLALIAALIADTLTKAWAEEGLAIAKPVQVVGGLVRLTLSYNSGVAFGLFDTGGVWPIILSGVILCGLFIAFIIVLPTNTLPVAAAWPSGLLLGGGLGNLIDRLPDGRVTDFLDIGIGELRWPTFNLADTLIVLSIGLLLLLINVHERTKQKEDI